MLKFVRGVLVIYPEGFSLCIRLHPQEYTGSNCRELISSLLLCDVRGFYALHALLACLVSVNHASWHEASAKVRSQALGEEALNVDKHADSYHSDDQHFCNTTHFQAAFDRAKSYQARERKRTCTWASQNSSGRHK